MLQLPLWSAFFFSADDPKPLWLRKGCGELGWGSKSHSSRHEDQDGSEEGIRSTAAVRTRAESGWVPRPQIRRYCTGALQQQVLDCCCLETVHRDMTDTMSGSFPLGTAEALSHNRCAQVLEEALLQKCECTKVHVVRIWTLHTCRRSKTMIGIWHVFSYTLVQIQSRKTARDTQLLTTWNPKFSGSILVFGSPEASPQGLHSKFIQSVKPSRILRISGTAGAAGSQITRFHVWITGSRRWIPQLCMGSGTQDDCGLFLAALLSQATIWEVTRLINVYICLIHRRTGSAHSP